jgi:hypothetical protein
MKTMGSLSLRNHFGAGGVVILMWKKMGPAGISLTNLDARSTEVPLSREGLEDWNFAFNQRWR